MTKLETTTEDCVARFHEITDKWIREHRQEYRGNRYCTVLYCTVLYCNVIYRGIGRGTCRTPT